MLTHPGIAGNTAGSPCRALPARVGVALLVLLGFGHGCSTSGPLRQEVSRAIDDWHRPVLQNASDQLMPPSGDTSAESNLGSDALDEGEGGEPVGSSPTAPPLEPWISEALSRNPEVLAAIAEVRAQLERVDQVTSLPDPMLRLAVRPEPIRTGAGDIHFVFGVGQKIPLPARLERAGRMAQADVRTAIERLNAARLKVIADVERAYYRVFLTDRSVELTRAHRVSLENLEQVIATQYRVGKAEQHDLLRIQTEVAKLYDNESRFTHQRASAAAALNQLLDYPPTREVPTTEPIHMQTFDGDVERLLALAVEHNPELAVLVRQVERERERVELADLGYWPDVTLGAEWTYIEPRDAFEPRNVPAKNINRMSETGTDSWALMLQFNVPIWFDRIEAAKQEARSRLLKTRHQKQAARNGISFRVFDAWTRVQTRQDTLELLASTLIPQARQTYDVSLTAYQAGRSNFLTVIDNWRRLLDFELMQHREVAGLETAFSQLQREVGLQLIRDDMAANADEPGEQP